MKERTLPGVHAGVFARIRQFLADPRGVRILELGAGEGAMAARLHQAGYDVEAVEIVADRFQVPGVPCRRLDLNGDFAEGFARAFDALVAVDVIEHLENPRHFLGDCLRLMKAGGLLFLSSPNVECWNSRLIFLRHGQLQQFGLQQYRGSGHITPLFTIQVDQMAGELGFELLGRWPVGSETDWQTARWMGGGGWALAGRAALRVLLRPLMRGAVSGATHLFVIRKPVKP